MITDKLNDSWVGTRAIKPTALHCLTCKFYSHGTFLLQCSKCGSIGVEYPRGTTDLTGCYSYTPESREMKQ